MSDELQVEDKANKSSSRGVVLTDEILLLASIPILISMHHLLCVCVTTVIHDGFRGYQSEAHPAGIYEWLM